MNQLRAAQLIPLAVSLATLSVATGTARADVLAGQVTDSRGNGVSSVDIDVDDATTGNRLPVDARSNDSGFYFVEVPAGLYHVNFDAPVRKGLVSKRVLFVTVAGDTPLSATLADGVLLDGTVVDEAGTAVAGADIDVDITATGERVRTPMDDTDANGVFAVVVPAGSMHLSIAPLGGSGLAPVQLRDLPVRRDTSVAITLRSGVRLDGRVEDDLGRDVVGADLDFTDLASGQRVPMQGDRTDAGGRFEVTLVPGRYRLATIPPPASGLAAELLPDLSVTRDTAIRVVTRPGARLTAVVRTVLGEPVINADLDFVRSDGLLYPVWNDRTGVDGGLRVVLPAAVYSVSISPPPGRGLEPMTDVPLPISGDLSVEWRLESTTVNSALAFAAVSPNPVRGPTELILAAPPGAVSPRVTVYDGRGRWINWIPMSRGTGSVFTGQWSGRDGDGRSLRTGIYFVIAESGPARAATKLVWVP